LALFWHKITLYIFSQGAHTIAGGLKSEQGLSPPGLPITLTIILSSVLPAPQTWMKGNYSIVPYLPYWTSCAGDRHNMPSPFDLLNLKVVPESRMTWATSVPILVFL